MFCAVGVFFFDHVQVETKYLGYGWILCICPQGVASGTLRATGRQAKAALVNFLCYYLVGLPMGISLALVAGLQTRGMWIGLSVGDGLQVHVGVWFGM